MSHQILKYQRLWQVTLNTLTKDLPHWPTRIETLAQVKACELRAGGQQWQDNEVLKALVYGLLSNSTQWNNVEPILIELDNILLEFNIKEIANLTPKWITTEVYPWFLERRAGSMTLKAGLLNLLASCRTLDGLIRQHGSLENWLQKVSQNGGARQVVIAIGSESSPTKLKGFGLPLAAEAAKNMGFSIAKPDRHLNRIMANWGLVHFKHWDPTAPYSAPIDCSEKELLAVIDAADQMAQNLGVSTVYLDNVLWLSAAQEGLHLSNQAYQAM